MKNQNKKITKKAILLIVYFIISIIANTLPIVAVEGEEIYIHEAEFDGHMELFTLLEEGEGVLRVVYSFLPPDVESEHMVKDEQDNMILDTKGDVLLGKMGFKLLNDEGTYDITKFALVEDTEYAPQKGININMDGIFASSSHYEAQSTFRFTEGKEEADLNLTNITVSHIDKVQDETTYKEYTLTPTFAPETLEYETTIVH